ncbi:prostaglandin F2 receptor negative regulator [Chanos chanos]|uniref:Prostaglandin F2 receptor negative regulator n=1 Tax=Chanos chanos TaxID=29144 RepID=A0A6J2VPJ1_CHACN|nr:prostaglandin F2 receptor negative regulator-like [Chanos chanos]
MAAGLCWSRIVTVPTGPLLRVEGQEVAIRCDVSDYEGPSEQDFEWNVLRGSDAVKLISSFDPSYSDQSLRDRVDSGDISINRLSDSSAELKIRGVRVTDSATYQCSTPSTDTVIAGNYHADVQLRVISDSLIITSEMPKPVVPEGKSGTLLCNVTHDFTEGSYLSINWSVRKGTSPAEDILTFGPEMGVTVGGHYLQRYEDGGLRLNLGSPGSFGLVLSRALPTDQGVYVCTARQWTKEVGGAWQKIQEKSSDMGKVTVTPTVDSLTVKVEDVSPLSVGDPLSLTCSVSMEDKADLGLEVTWLLNDTQVLIHMARNGLVANSSDAVRVTRVGESDFRLTVGSLELSDSGLYSCRVNAWVPLSGGQWYQSAKKTSKPVLVVVGQKDPDFSVTLVSSVTAQFPGDPTELECQVTNVSHLRNGRLGVSWHYTATTPMGDTTTMHVIASLDENGALRPAEKYRARLESGLISVTRVEPNTFKLRFLRAMNADAGNYACSVTAWALSRNGNWERAAEFQTPVLKLSLATKKPALSVGASRLREATASGSTFEMSCRVAGDSLQGASFSVIIQFQESVLGPVRKVISLSSDSVLKLEDASEPDRLDSVSLVKSGAREFRFRIQGVQVSDRGYYWCQIGAWTQQPGEDRVEVVSGDSNKVQIDFEHTGPSFLVSISSDTTSVYPWEPVKMQCEMVVAGTSPNTDDVAYEIRWFLTRIRDSDDPILLISMDRWGVVRKVPRNDSSDLSLERSDSQKYLLGVHSTQDSDAGEYHCIATPWLRSPASGKWSKAPDAISKRVFLSVKFAFWDSMKLPLLYGVCASAFMGIFSLLLGLICAHCCCRNTTSTPRSRNKLMDLEMD